MVHLVIQEKQVFCEKLYYNSFLMLELLAVIYEYFALRVLLIYVRASVRSDPFLSHSEIFEFTSRRIKLQ